MALVLALARPAGAVNHLIAVDQVLGSWQGNDTVQFVVLRLLAAGQTALSNGGGGRGTTELIFDDAGATAGGRREFVFTMDLANGAAGARVLIGTTALQAVTGVTPDFILPAGFLAPRAGRVCYVVNPPQSPFQTTGVIDCVAYGTFSGDNGRFGAPTRVTPDNRALQRVAMGGSNATDWAGALEPMPQNNAGQGTTMQTLCGDDAISQGEDCDGTNLGGKTCATEGFATGTLACRQCHFDTRACSFCGNGSINGREECDGDDLKGRTCAGLGFTGGTLACTDTCRISTLSCDPTFFVQGAGAGPDCLAQWRVANPAHRPGVNGKAPVRQRCTDGDGGCDADTVAGTCTFTVAVCLDRSDPRLPHCGRVPIGGVTLLSSATANDVGGRLLAALAALGPSTLAGDTVSYAPPLTAIERCTASVAIPVPTRGRRAGTLVLRMRTAADGGRPRDTDTLKLVCQP